MLANNHGKVRLWTRQDKLIYTDMDKWGYVVNYFYLPKDTKDEEDLDPTRPAQAALWELRAEDVKIIKGT